MLRPLLRFIWTNLGTLLLAFALAFAVWISAVVAADPNEVRDYPSTLTVEVRGQSPSLIMIGNLPSQVSVRLGAPVSLWDRLSQTDMVTAYIDLSGLDQGEHTVPIEIESELRPVRVVDVAPQEVTITLEPRAVKELPVTVVVQGQPALGFLADEVIVSPLVATVSGPESLVNEVAEIQAVLNVDGARETIDRQVDLQAVDDEGSVLSGLTIDPQFVAVEQNIRQATGYRDVAVKVETIGQPANGFRVTNISVTPLIVTLFSTDAQLIASLPGFVSTMPLDLTNLDENLQTRLALALPQGVIVQGEQNVEVIIGIAPIESSLLVTYQVEVIGLATGYEAELSPQSVSVVLSGPLSVLQSLTANDVRIFVDLAGLSPGTHLIEPQVEILPGDVQVLSITPSSIQVVITQGN
jgi:YbbR domain-containing protein